MVALVHAGSWKKASILCLVLMVCSLVVVSVRGTNESGDEFGDPTISSFSEHRDFTELLFTEFLNTNPTNETLFHEIAQLATDDELATLFGVFVLHAYECLDVVYNTTTERLGFQELAPNISPRYASVFSSMFPNKDEYCCPLSATFFLAQHLLEHFGPDIYDAFADTESSYARTKIRWYTLLRDGRQHEMNFVLDHCLGDIPFETCTNGTLRAEYEAVISAYDENIVKWKRIQDIMNIFIRSKVGIYGLEISELDTDCLFLQEVKKTSWGHRVYDCLDWECKDNVMKFFLLALKKFHFATSMTTTITDKAGSFTEMPFIVSAPVDYDVSRLKPTDPFE